MKRLSIVWISLLFIIGAFNAHAVQPKPPTSTSWYVAPIWADTDNVLYGWMYSKGYAAGQVDLNTPGTQDSVVILALGNPRISGGVYGASGYGRFLSVNTMRLVAYAFAAGYWDGSGSDGASQMRIVLGTNNSVIDGYTDTFLYNHGAAWVQMVKDTAVTIQPFASQVMVFGGNDIEMGYSFPGKAISWVNGYASGYVAPYYLFNFGSADGCPLSGTTAVPGACVTVETQQKGYVWSQNDIEYISWRARPSYPLPQIYGTGGGNAKQWQQIALYSYLKYNQDMFITAPLSQSQACTQNGGCAGTNNTPIQAWNQLWNELNSNVSTFQDFWWSTDIKWRQP
ncbi:MAG: hypothetical protein AAB552_01855 [Patescibacteria group bacterium]